MPIIKVENLSKVFGKDPERAIKMLEDGKSKNEIVEKTKLAVGVANASFEVEKGELLVVMGLSGSGKSTLIRCVNRLIEPTTGKIYVNDQDITKLSQDELLELRRKKFGMVFQRFALFPHRTVLDNTAYGLEIQGVPDEERRKKAMDALELVGLKGWEDHMPSQLSGGMQQRVGLARALAIDPDILLMDEAFSALDPLIKREMQDELVALQNRVHKTILFITHDLDEALKLGDRIVLMKDGKIVQIGTGEDILTNPANEYVEKFVENVDKSKVLTAEAIMAKPREIAFPKDGPRIALHKMEENGFSSIFVVDKDWTLKGIVLADDAAAAAKRGEKTIDNIIDSDITTVRPDHSVNELFGMMANLKHPLAVTDEAGKLKGVVVRGSVLAGLSREPVDIEEVVNG